jgi:hypothetical protein
MNLAHVARLATWPYVALSYDSGPQRGTDCELDAGSAELNTKAPETSRSDELLNLAASS